MKYFEKILIANRGEIAIRVMRACREVNVETVAIYSTADNDALHVKYADEAFLVGEAPPSRSYLNIERIVDIAKKSGSEAIHPGYGFLAENYHFAKRCTEEGITFIGPSWKTIRAMGSKIESKQMMREAGVPVVPGTPGGVKGSDEAKRVAEEIGYPVIVKASAGGGGIGMQIVDDEAGLEDAISAGMRMAESAFGDATVFIEKYMVKPRHIEFQILADEHGNVIHLYDRECSIQRRHQKLVEEAPCPIMTDELRDRMSRIGYCRRESVRLLECRNSGVPLCRWELLLHGDEYPAPGRAHGDRAHHRASISSKPSLRLPPERPCSSTRRTSASGGMQSSAGSMQKIRSITLPPTLERSSDTGLLAGRESGLTREYTWDTPSLRITIR